MGNTTQFIVHINYTGSIDVVNYYAAQIHGTQKFIANPQPYIHRGIVLKMMN